MAKWRNDPLALDGAWRRVFIYSLILHTVLLNCSYATSFPSHQVRQLRSNSVSLNPGCFESHVNSLIAAPYIPIPFRALAFVAQSWLRSVEMVEQSSFDNS